MRIRFDELVLRGKREGVCKKCGRRTRRTVELRQSTNLFSRVCVGESKSWVDVQAELKEEVKKVEESALLCARCERALMDELCALAPRLQEAVGDDRPRAAQALRTFVGGKKY